MSTGRHSAGIRPSCRSGVSLRHGHNCRSWSHPRKPRTGRSATEPQVGTPPSVERRRRPEARAEHTRCRRAREGHRGAQQRRRHRRIGFEPPIEPRARVRVAQLALRLGAGDAHTPGVAVRTIRIGRGLQEVDAADGRVTTTTYPLAASRSAAQLTLVMSAPPPGSRDTIGQGPVNGATTCRQKKGLQVRSPPATPSAFAHERACSC